MAEKIQQIFARGFLYSCGIVFNRVVPARLFRFRVFNVYELGPADDAITTLQDALVIRGCTSDDDIAAAETLTHFRTNEPLLAGDDRPELRATLIVDAEIPVGGAWLSHDFFDETDLGIRMRLQSDQAWLFAAFVTKSHRRRGLYVRLLGQILTDTDRTVFASVNSTNKASIAAHRTFARRKVGSCVAVKVGPWSTCQVRGDLQIDRGPRPTEIRIR
jgi:hypothetical protein